MRSLRSDRPFLSSANLSWSGPEPGSRKRTTRCIAPWAHSSESSVPGMSSTPDRLASMRASAMPDWVSWSVRAMALSPPAAAKRTTALGVSDPSEAVE